MCAWSPRREYGKQHTCSTRTKTLMYHMVPWYHGELSLAVARLLFREIVCRIPQPMGPPVCAPGGVASSFEHQSMNLPLQGFCFASASSHPADGSVASGSASSSAPNTEDTADLQAPRTTGHVRALANAGKYSVSQRARPRPEGVTDTCAHTCVRKRSCWHHPSLHSRGGRCES